MPPCLGTRKSNQTGDVCQKCTPREMAYGVPAHITRAAAKPGAQGAREVPWNQVCHEVHGGELAPLVQSPTDNAHLLEDRVQRVGRTHSHFGFHFRGRRCHGSPEAAQLGDH